TLLSWMSERADASESDHSHLAHLETVISLAAIHTSQMSAVHVLYDLNAHLECLEDIRQEIREDVQKEEDSFMKESQRLKPLSMLSYHRLMQGRHVLRDGTVLPSGAHICMPVDTIQKDPEVTTDPEGFDGFRYYKQRQDPGEGGLHQFAPTEKNILNFGHGKHACPVRFFASLEIKVILVRLIMNYDFGFVEVAGGRPIYGRTSFCSSTPTGSCRLDSGAHTLSLLSDPYLRVGVISRIVVYSIGIRIVWFIALVPVVLIAHEPKQMGGLAAGRAQTVRRMTVLRYVSTHFSTQADLHAPELFDTQTWVVEILDFQALMSCVGGTSADWNRCFVETHTSTMTDSMAAVEDPSLQHYGSILLMHRRQSGPPSRGPPGGMPRYTSLAPPGVTPNYVNPDTIGDQITITGLTLIIFSALFVIARWSVKLGVVKKRSWDDCETPSRIGLAGADAGDHYHHKYEEERILEDHTDAGSGGTLLPWVPHLGHSTVRAFFDGRDAEERELPTSTEGKSRRDQLLFISDMLYLVSNMSTKIAILLLYKALFGVKRSFRYLCYGMMAIVTSYCVIFFFVVAFNCNPVQKTWHTLTYRGPGRCLARTVIQFVIGGFNIATDFMILIMPMPIILHLKMDSKRRIGLLVIFGTGIIACASTIVREVILVHNLRDANLGGPRVVQNARNSDTSWNNVPYTLTSDHPSTVENDIGIICACLPSLAPLRTTRFFSKTVPEFVSYLRSKSSYRSSNGVLDYHTSAESGVDLVNNAPKNRAYTSTNHGERGLTHENGTIKRETDMQVSYSSRPDAMV
ncbi:MAG: hypothetical protein Q9226_008280, partial [Calogaya cf. arnoldii]